MLSSKFIDRIEVTFLPTESMEFAKSIGFTKVDRPGIVGEIVMADNPRNVDGYRSKLDKDLARLRAEGAVLRPTYNEAGKAKQKELDAKQKEKAAALLGADNGGSGKPIDKPSKAVK